MRQLPCSTRFRFTTLFLNCLIVVGVLCGCGGNQERVPVHGLVTLDGKPLPVGTVSFMGEGGYAVASGDIHEGKYTVSESGNRRGIPPGTYGVRITSWLEQPGAELPGGGFAEGKSAIPVRYSEPKTSGFTADIQPNHVQFDFELRSK